MWRTSTWCSIYIYPDNTGRYSKITENSEVRMSRRMDTSSGTQMTELMIQYRRSSWSSWTESLCIVRTTISRSFIQTWMMENTDLTTSICSPETRIILVDVRWRHQNIKKELEYSVHEEKLMKIIDLKNLRRFSISSTYDTLNVTAIQLKPLLKNTQRCWNHVFQLKQQKNCLAGKILRKNNCMILRHGRTYLEIRGKTQWIDEQESCVIAQSFKFLLGWSSIQEKRNLNQWKTHNLSWNTCIWHELDVLIFYGLSINWLV